MSRTGVTLYQAIIWEWTCPVCNHPMTEYGFTVDGEEVTCSDCGKECVVSEMEYCVED